MKKSNNTVYYLSIILLEKLEFGTGDIITPASSMLASSSCNCIKT